MVRQLPKLYWIFLLYLVLRLFFIFNFPPYVDESSYLYVSQLMLSSPDLSFLSVSLWGKQPLPFWLMSIGASVFQNNPLAGSRLVILLISLPSFFILYRLIKNLKNESAAIIGILIYSLAPFFIISHSLAIIDGILLPLSIIVLYIIFRLWKKFNFRLLVILGIILGISFWVKSTSLFLIAFAFFSLIYISRDTGVKPSKIFTRVSVILLIIGAIGMPLITHPAYPVIWSENTRFAFTMAELISLPFNAWGSNFLHFILSGLIYFTPLVVLTFNNMPGKVKDKKYRFLIIWFLVSVFLIALTGRHNIFRYYSFGLAPLLIIWAISLSGFIAKYKTFKPVAYLFIMPVALASLLLIFNPPVFFGFFPKNSVLASERDYAYSWPAGFGVREMLSFILDSTKGSQIILIQPYNGANNIHYYILGNRQYENAIKVIQLDVSPEDGFKQLEPLAKNTPLYHVSNNLVIPEAIKKNLKLIKSIPKPGDGDFIGLYEVVF